MFRRVRARIGLRGVIRVAAALGVAMVAAPLVTACSSSASPAAASAQAATGNGTCTTTITGQTVRNVFVPAGHTCTLENVIVHGNITDYGTLNLTTSAAIGGSVVAKPGSQLIESGPTSVTVDGNLTINGTTSAQLSLDHIRGNFTVEHVMKFSWTDSVIGKNIFWLNNGGGNQVIGGNTVDGNINCSGNAAVPTNGGNPNTVHGHETGQCAGLH